jgi:DNA-binding transcriptional MerR regulator
MQGKFGMTKFTIGQLASATGCKIPTIRYYERIGLLPEPHRSSGNTRLYEQTHQERLGFIQHCRELGFSQADVRALLELSDHPDHSCEAVTDIARAHLEDVTRKIAGLRALKTELEGMIKNCGGGQVRQCRIVEALANYAPSQM